MILFTLLVLAQDLAGLSSEGATAMRAKQYPAAALAYQQLVEKDATNPMWRLNLGMALFYAADHAGAVGRLSALALKLGHRAQASPLCSNG